MLEDPASTLSWILPDPRAHPPQPVQSHLSCMGANTQCLLGCMGTNPQCHLGCMGTNTQCESRGKAHGNGLVGCQGGVVPNGPSAPDTSLDYIRPGLSLIRGDIGIARISRFTARGSVRNCSWPVGHIHVEDGVCAAAQTAQRFLAPM